MKSETPRRRVAEAFAKIFAPATGAADRVVLREGLFPPLRRPAQFAGRVHLLTDESIPILARAVVELAPDKVEQLMSEDPHQFWGMHQ